MLFPMEMSGFAIRLQAELDARGIDRKALSEATDIPYHRMTSWFRRAKSKPRGDDLLVVAKYLDLDQAYLLSGGKRQPFNPQAAVLAQAALLDDSNLRKLADFAQFLLQQQEQRATEPEPQPSPQEYPDPA
jgi:hypothetical protein